PRAARESLLRAHSAAHVDAVLDRVAEADGAGRALPIDPDTAVSAGSGEAALRAAGAVLAAVDAVLAGEAVRAFCAIRPPGHHAERVGAMGFCLFGNVAIGALHARAVHGLARVAVVDFDVHHGNGTQAILEGDRGCLYASLHQWPLYPGTGRPDERGPYGTVHNVPLPEGADGAAVLSALEGRILPALAAFAPELLLISAGFDGHRTDPLAGWRLEAADYGALTRALCGAVAASAGGRVVSALEGGYDLTALGACAGAHVGALMED
ncbi:MAG: histone deacetylase family protein, partial [Alphaproteobacteria bacterium]|nr:histone deacetylase family protein [Alphaproteobacteria bacterium]